MQQPQQPGNSLPPVKFPESIAKQIKEGIERRDALGWPTASFEQGLEVMFLLFGGWPAWRKLNKPAEDLSAPASPVEERVEDRAEYWVAVKEELPDEGGRYWCYVEEVNDLGKSHFQWNCCFDPYTQSFSDNLITMSVTHWQPLAPSPKQRGNVSKPSPVIEIGERKPFGLSETEIAQLLGKCLKPEEIAGEASVQLERVKELIMWFRRYTEGNANPKWFQAHAFELAYYIATNAGNRFIDLHTIKMDAWREGVMITPAERAMFERFNLIPAASHPAPSLIVGEREEVICPDCGGDGKETCHNPDHNFIDGVWGDTQRLGCPVCGHNEKYKVNGGKNKCETCNGQGHIPEGLADKWADDNGYQDEFTPYTKPAPTEQALPEGVTDTVAALFNTRRELSAAREERDIFMKAFDTARTLILNIKRANIYQEPADECDKWLNSNPEGK